MATGGDELRPSSVWIVHRDPRERAALARLAAAGENTLLGAPGDSLFESAPPPDVVVLGVAGDFERELEFAHRMAPRLHPCAWVLVAEAADAVETRRLFEDLPSELLLHPPPGADLRRAIRSKLRLRSAQSLSQRRRRDRLSERFSHWFGEFEVTGLLRALDPKLSQLPLLVRGETGTGRALIARYVHAFGGGDEKPFIHVACEGSLGEEDLLEQLETAGSGATVWLDEVDALPIALQRHVSDWIDFGLPDPAGQNEPVRWMASAHEESDSGGRRLDARLAQLLSVLSIHTPTLRERPEAIEAFAQETARSWDATRGMLSRSFAADALELLRGHPWPGNLRELEAVLVRTLSAGRSDPIPASQLRFDAAGEWGRVDNRSAHAGERQPPAPPPPVATAPPPQLSEEPAFDAETLALDQLGPAMDTADMSEPPDLQTSATAPPKPVDVAALLDGLLDELRERIQSRRLLVLKELDRAEPFVLGDAEALRGAFAALLGHALVTIPDRGDMYLASSHHPAGLLGRPSVRVLLRYRKPDPETARPSFDPEAATAESADRLFARAEEVVRELGGAFTGDSADPRETVVVIDLPAPGPAPQA